MSSGIGLKGPATSSAVMVYEVSIGLPGHKGGGHRFGRDVVGARKGRHRLLMAGAVEAVDLARGEVRAVEHHLHPE